MSLDVYLTLPEPNTDLPREAIFVRRDGATVEISRDEWDEANPGCEPVMAIVNADAGDRHEVFSSNVTHNLTIMADAAGVYRPMWRPEEVGITKAGQLIAPLTDGLAALRADPAKFKALNPPNGWGTYDGLVEFVRGYLAACVEHPGADVSVSR